MMLSTGEFPWGSNTLPTQRYAATISVGVIKTVLPSWPYNSSDSQAIVDPTDTFDEIEDQLDLQASDAALDEAREKGTVPLERIKEEYDL